MSKWGRTPEYFEGLSQPEKLVEVLSDPWPANESISGDHIANRLGAKDWRSISSNVMTDTVKQRVLENLGWTYETKRGPAAESWFKKKAKATLNPIHWDGRTPLQQLCELLGRLENCSESPNTTSIGE
jgi:hypothetical protein